VTFGDICNLTAEWLAGSKTENPWHGDSVDPETVPLLESLIKINNLGLNTVEGQPGTCIYDEWSAYLDCKYDEMQRGYLVGFLDARYLRDFIAKIREHPVVVVLPGETEDKPPIIVNESLLKDHDMLGPEGRISLTIDRNERQGKGWNYYTNMSVTEGQKPITDGEPTPAMERILRACTQEIKIVRAPRCQTDLDKIVLDVMLTVADLDAHGEY
jgi:hypothetical protein